MARAKVAGRLLRRGFGAGVLAAAVIVLLLPAGSAPVGPPPVLAPEHVAASATGPCLGPTLSSTVNGTLGVLGNETPRPSVAGVNLSFEYNYQAAVTVNGSTTYQCHPGSQGIATRAGGSFSFNVTLPRGGCNGFGCTTYTGPYGTESFHLAGSDPPAYVLRGTVSVPVTHLEFVAVFDHLAITPPGPKTLSANAETRFWAVPTAADGTPSPATWNASWTVGGSGWTLSNSSGDSTVLFGPAGVSPTTLSVQVNGSWAGRPVPGHTASIAVNAVATTVSAASVNPTKLDAGAPTTFTLEGTGAEGYNYTASVFPGLGLGTVTGNCSNSSSSHGEVNLLCSLTVTYTESGSTTPSGNITNGHSGADTQFPALTVASALELGVRPDPVVGYVGEPVTITGTVTSDTGTGPFGPACLSDGAGALVCSNESGPSWSFDPMYGATGNYTGRFSVLDSAGVNASRTVAVEIGTRPRLDNLTASPGAVAPGATIALGTELTGGIGTLTYWWNDSDPAATISAGTRGAPGSFSFEYRARTEGVHLLTLTVVDQLGSKAATEVQVYVLPGPATEIDPVPAVMNSTWEAGVPEPFVLVAETSQGERVPEYAGPLALNWTNGAIPPGTVFVNTSMLGALPVGPGSGVAIPENAWYAGYLNLTVTVLRAANEQFRFEGPLPVRFAGGGTLTVQVTADLGALRLTDPTVAAGGARENRTLWHVVDPFGNPAPTGFVTVTENFGGAVVSARAPIVVDAASATVWINYSAPTAGSGEVTVRSEWGELLLGPIEVPAAAANGPLLLGALAAGSVAAFAGVVLVATRRRGHGPGAPEIDPDELRAEAEGRDRLLTRIRTEGPIELEELLTGGPPPRPDRARASDWLASLITEGLVRPSTGTDGVARLEAVAVRAMPAPPRVDLDPSVLERVLEDSRADAAADGTLEAP